CPEYFERQSDYIRNFFTPMNSHLKNVDTLISTGRKNSDVIIGIHIRHGDYKNHAGGKYYYSLNQYKEIMQRALLLFPDKKISFLVCSNANENMDVLNGLNIIKGTGHELEDLYSFAKCDYISG